MENNVCYRPLGPRDKYNRGNFALVRTTEQGCYVEVFIHRGSGLYEHKESFVCCSDEVEQLLSEYHRY